jgi:hypothetical protein
VYKIKLNRNSAAAIPEILFTAPLLTLIMLCPKIALPPSHRRNRWPRWLHLPDTGEIWLAARLRHIVDQIHRIKCVYCYKKASRCFESTAEMEVEN